MNRSYRIVEDIEEKEEGRQQGDLKKERGKRGERKLENKLHGSFIVL